MRSGWTSRAGTLTTAYDRKRKPNRRTQPRTQHREGFTLIELLVVIAIIGILASILFPVFARVRQKAYQASCASNLKQIAQAILMYADDHGGYGPVSHGMGCFADVTTSATCAGGACNSALALGPYGCAWADYYIQQPGSPNRVSEWKINPVWLCNGNGTGTYKMGYSRGGTWHQWEPQGGSYGAGSGGGRVRNPAKALLVADAWGLQAMDGTMYGSPRAVYGYWYHFITTRDPNDIRNGAPDYNSTYYQRYWKDLTAHNGGNNIAFCDGHVKWMDAQAMMGDTDWWVQMFQ
jgi:prepilin-type N-terminal cleavage/methylation domain-containing protein/prepilin-type processing-associated H-X9-DG protein